MIKMEINQKVGRKISQARMQNITKTVHRGLKLKKDYHFSLAIVSDQEIKKLNFVYRKKNRPTDVLSFCLAESKARAIMPKEKNIDLGEIVISLPTARKQAREAGHSIEKEISILLIHGILHLFGYDHVKTKDRLIMERLEEKILQNEYK